MNESGLERGNEVPASDGSQNTNLPVEESSSLANDAEAEMIMSELEAHNAISEA